MATLADVAKRANVSKMTVSRVINHPNQVTNELKELVFAAMAELDYRPNIAAKALVSNRSQIIKLFILEEIDTTEPYYMHLLMGIARKIGTAHYSLQLVTKDAFDIGSCDGYIITGVRHKDYEWIHRLEKPVVLFGENNEGLDYVDTDNEYGTYQSTQYAFSRAYQQIIFIGIDVDEPFERSREQGYKRAMQEMGQAQIVFKSPNRSTESAKLIQEKWDQFSINTCFVCGSDRLALGVLRTIMKMQGKVSEDYGVIGFDGVFLDQISAPKLTTIKQEIVGMGEMCGEMILKKIDENGASQGYKKFFPELIIRETTK